MKEENQTEVTDSVVNSHGTLRQEKHSSSSDQNSAALPVATKRSNKKQTTDYESLQRLYNTHKPEAWASCQVLNEGRKRKLKKLHQEHGDGLHQLLVDALTFVITDGFWNGADKNFGIDNLLKDNRLIEFAEKQPKRHGQNPEPTLVHQEVIIAAEAAVIKPENGKKLTREQIQAKVAKGLKEFYARNR